MRVSYVKVAEFQRRGALHFHCVLRLDGVDEDGELEPPAPRARRRAADRRRARGRPARVGALPRSRRRAAGCPARARAGARDPLGRAGRGARARHRGSAEDVGVVRGLHRQVRDQVHRGGRRADVPARSGRPRAAEGPPARRGATSSARGGSAATAHLQALRLRRWAHQLGFRGHCFTKSRRYSTTFTALRQARHEHQLRARRRAARRGRAESARWQLQRLGLPDAGRRAGSPSPGANARSSSDGSRARSCRPAER